MYKEIVISIVVIVLIVILDIITQNFTNEAVAYMEDNLLALKEDLINESSEEQVQEKMEEMANTKVEEKVVDPILTYTLKITGKTSQMKALRQFLDTNGMQYEKVS